MKKYIKPQLRPQTKNTFVFDVMKTHIKKPITCNQCSSCHSCRG